MGPLGPMTTRVWTRISRQLLGELGGTANDRRRAAGLGYRDDTEPGSGVNSVRMMNLQPALWEEEEDPDPAPDLKSVMGV